MKISSVVILVLFLAGCANIEPMADAPDAYTWCFDRVPEPAIMCD